MFLPPAHPIEADNLNLNIMLIRPEESGIVMLIIGTVLSLFVWCPDTRWCHGDMMSPSWDADATMNNYGLWVSSVSVILRPGDQEFLRADAKLALTMRNGTWKKPFLLL